jgi:hypothetical protein
MRTDANAARAGEVMKRIVGPLGTAGGHDQIAGAQLSERVPSGTIITPGFDQICDRLIDELDLTRTGEGRLLRD